MSFLSKLKMPRPGQLLALVSLALLLGVLVFATQADGMERLAVAAYKAWLLTMYAALGLAVDQIVFHYARPGKFRRVDYNGSENRSGLHVWNEDVEDRIFVHCMYRRAAIIGSIVLAGGLAL